MTEAKLVMRRIVAVWTGDESEPLGTFRFDVLTDRSGRPRASGPSSGWQGTLGNNAEMYPFILMRDGTLDFGASYDDVSARYGRTNLLTREHLEKGQYFSLETDGEEDTYRITHSVPIALANDPEEMVQ